MATIKARYGFGQVEPNHLSFQATKQAYGQLPVPEDMEVVENGMFLKYDIAKGLACPDGAGEWMLVYNEIKLYDDWRESYKDFAMQKKNYTPGADAFTAPEQYSSAKYIPANAGEMGLEMDQVGPYDYPAEPISHGGMGKYLDDSLGKPGFNGTMYPRLVKTDLGDIFTTNTFKGPGAYRSIIETNVLEDIELGTLLTPNAKGYLDTEGADTADFAWQVVKVYTMPDGQPAAKIQRVK